jgi:transposase
MRIIGCDLHARQQSLAMLHVETGEIEERTLEHEGEAVREFYAGLPGPVRVGIEATGSMQWFLELMDELGVECVVGHPAKIRACEPRKQKHDRRDALLLMKLLAEDRFPAIWMPSVEQRDVRALLLHRHQWVRIRVRLQNALQSIALSHAIRRGAGLWSHGGQQTLAELVLPPHAGARRSELMRLYQQLQREIEMLDKEVARTAEERAAGAAADDASGGGTDHGAGDGSLPWRSGTLHRWQGGGELCGDDPERVLQRRQAALRRTDESKAIHCCACCGAKRWATQCARMRN